MQDRRTDSESPQDAPPSGAAASPDADPQAAAEAPPADAAQDGPADPADPAGAAGEEAPGGAGPAPGRTGGKGRKGSAGAADDGDAADGGDAAAARIAELEDAAAGLRDRLLRQMAENDNARKRSERQLADARRYAAAGLARDLFDVADNLRRALDAVPSDAAAQGDGPLAGLVGGLEAVERDLARAFSRHQIVKLEPLDEPFDPNFHQAMFEVDTADRPAGTVVRLLQAGYMLHDRLLRPAMVGVARVPVDGSGPGAGAAPDAGGPADGDAAAGGAPDDGAAG